MAEFSADFEETYWGSSGNNIGGSGGTFVISDGDADSTEFTIGEAITVSQSGGYTYTGTFLGTVEVEGNTYVAMEGTSSGTISGPFKWLIGKGGTIQTDFPANWSEVDAQLDTADFTVCFAAGTLIATPEGETAVERLAIGDLVTTADGRSVAVKWVGRQTVHKLFTPRERFVPVRVTAGALGNGLPHSDLVLTADHALILDGLAINASALVNGTTICWEPAEALPGTVTYYHVETQEHDVILANGAAAESYVDYIQRRGFDNFAEYAELYGEERTIAEMDLPRVSSARLLPPEIRLRLNGAAAA